MTTTGQGRRYDASGRRRQARANRDAVLVAARRLFPAQGYADTSVAQIASAAGVSERTVFVGFGSKVNLLKEALDAAIAGDSEPVPLHERPAMRRVHEARTAGEAFRAFADAAVEVSERAHGMYSVVHRAADGDPQIAALERALEAQRLTGAGYLAATFARLVGVDDPREVQRMRDTVWALGSPLQYGLLVGERGWTAEAYRVWLTRALAALVPPVPPIGPAGPDRAGAS